MTDRDGKKKIREAKNTTMDGTGLASAGIKPPVYDIIGKRLRQYYDGVSKQPVPDRFLDLLDQLEAKTSKKDE